MRRLKHPFLIGLVEILLPTDPTTFDTLYVVMEFAESDLKKIIKSNINLEMIHIQTIVYNLLCGIKYLHDSNVLHRDLKPANVLINEDCTVKLCDYGLARSISGIQSADIFLKKVKKGNNSADSSSDAEDSGKLSVSSVSGGLSGGNMIKLNIAGQVTSTAAVAKVQSA
jgi:serine/threonine protein kinase